MLDVTTSELANELLGGVYRSGPDRLTAAALRGVSQVISLGGLDLVNFGSREIVPAKFFSRRLHQFRADMVLVRTTPEENDKLGKEIAEKASAARRLTAVMIPLQGLSSLDARGEPFWWPEANAALFRSLRNWMSPNVDLIELDVHINDPSFAQAMVEKLVQMIGR
jgi:uncharacterized protein (UPF0261 family)